MVMNEYAGIRGNKQEVYRNLEKLFPVFMEDKAMSAISNKCIKKSQKG